jgi:hypothetical protein
MAWVKVWVGLITFYASIRSFRSREQSDWQVEFLFEGLSWQINRGEWTFSNKNRYSFKLFSIYWDII